MNRDEARSRITADIVDGIEYMSEENVYELINNIYDSFEKDLKDINNQVSRLKKQLSKGHHVECSCSFCKPLACSYVDNNFTFTSCDDCKNKK